MRRCPHCKALNPQANVLCSKCSQPLDMENSPFNSPTATAPKTSAPAPTATAPTATGAPVSNSPVSNTPLSNPVASAPAAPLPAAPASAAPAPVAPAASAPAVSAAPMSSISVSMPTEPALVQAPLEDEGTPYKASGRCTGAGIGLLLLAAIGGGFAVGSVYHLIARFIDLMVLFPIAAGFVLGCIGMKAVRAGKCRNAKLVTVCMIVGALTVYGTKLFWNSRQVRSEMVAALAEGFVSEMGGTNGGEQKAAPGIAAQTAAAQTAAVQQAIDRAMTPWRTFRMYMEFQAEAGVSLSRHGSGGINIAGGWYWGLLTFEIFLVGLTAVGTASSGVGVPFCERCNGWMNEETMIRVNSVQNPVLLQRAQARDWQGLVDTPVGGAAEDKAKTDVVVASCPACSASTLSLRTGGGNRDLLHMHIAHPTAERIRQLRNEMNRRATEAPSDVAPEATGSA